MALAMWNRSGSLSPGSLSLKQLLLDTKAGAPYVVARDFNAIVDGAQQNAEVRSIESIRTYYSDFPAQRVVTERGCGTQK